MLRIVLAAALLAHGPELRPRNEGDAAESGLRVQDGHVWEGLADRLAHALGQGEVHPAHDRPMLVDERIEGAVAEPDHAVRIRWRRLVALPLEGFSEDATR